MSKKADTFMVFHGAQNSYGILFTWYIPLESSVHFASQKLFLFLYFRWEGAEIDWHGVHPYF